MNRSRRSGATLLALLAVLGGSSACGKKGGDVPRLPAGGTVLLPPGSSLAMGSLRVVGAQGSASITSGGKFTATVPGGGPALVGLFDSSDRLILLGYVDALDPAAGEVSPRQTGVALLFQAIGAPLLPPGLWKEALALIAASPQADALAAVIDARVAASPTALLDGDAAIADALQAAAAELVPLPAPPPALRLAPAARRQAALSAVAPSEAFSKVTVDTPGTQSGITIRVNPDGDGIVVDNDYRRHLMYFVYRTGYVPDAADAAEVPVPWGELTRGFLMGTSGATSVLGTLNDLANGTVHYASSTSSPIPLPMNPPDAKRTNYRVVVVGAGQDASWPATLASPDPYGLKDEWARRADDMTTLFVWKDLLLPALCTFVPAERVAKSFGVDAESIDFALDVFGLLAKGGVDIATPIAAGNYRGAVTEFISAIVNNGAVRTAVFEKLLTAPGLAAQKGSMELLASSTAKVFVVLKAVDVFLTGADISTIVVQAQQSSLFVGGEAKAAKPTVRINPAAAQVSPSSQVGLTCEIPDITGTFAYHWETSGAFGHLEDDRGHTGKAFDSTDASVRYVVDTSLAGNSDTVAVQGYLVPDGGVGPRIDLGRGTSTVTIACEPFPQAVHSGCGSATAVAPATVAKGGLITISFTQRSGGLCGGSTSVSVNVPGQFVSYPGGTLSYGVVTYEALPTDPSSAARTLTFQLSTNPIEWAGVVMCPRALGYYEPPGSTTGPYVEVSTSRWWDLVPFTVTQQ